MDFLLILNGFQLLFNGFKLFSVDFLMVFSGFLHTNGTKFIAILTQRTEADRVTSGSWFPAELSDALSDGFLGFWFLLKRR